MCVQAWRQLQLFVHQSTCGTGNTGLALSERLTVLVCPNSLSFSVVWSPWPWSFHEDTTARSPPRPTVHLLRSILDLPSARWDVGWSCPTPPSRAHRLRTPRLFISSVYFIPFLSRLFMSINLTVYHLPRSLHSSVNALLSSSAPSPRRTEAFCLCMCTSVCTCVCVYACMCVCKWRKCTCFPDRACLALASAATMLVAAVAVSKEPLNSAVRHAALAAVCAPSATNHRQRSRAAVR